MPYSVLLSLLCAVLFALVHVFAGRLRFLEGLPRSRWLSAAGGVSVAYVFVHLLPELSEHQAGLEERGIAEAVGFLEHHVYLVALLGLVMFYGLERAALHTRRKGSDEPASPAVFWLHLGAFSVYNALIGYLLLHRESTGAWDLAFYFVALALHFVVNDFALREHHRHRYQRLGRWMLAGAVLAGAVLGLLVTVEEAFLAVLFAFLAGGIVLNVLKEELPEERESRFGAFVLGCGLYAAMLLLAG